MTALNSRESVVMVLGSLDPGSGRVGGARYVLEKMSSRHLYRRLSTGTHKGYRPCLPGIPCGFGDEKVPVLGFRRL